MSGYDKPWGKCNCWPLFFIARIKVSTHELETGSHDPHECPSYLCWMAAWQTWPGAVYHHYCVFGHTFLRGALLSHSRWWPQWRYTAPISCMTILHYNNCSNWPQLAVGYFDCAYHDILLSKLHGFLILLDVFYL